MWQGVVHIKSIFSFTGLSLEISLHSKLVSQQKTSLVHKNHKIVTWHKPKVFLISLIINKQLWAQQQKNNKFYSEQFILSAKTTRFIHHYNLLAKLCWKISSAVNTKYTTTKNMHKKKRILQTFVYVFCSQSLLISFMSSIHFLLLTSPLFSPHVSCTFCRCIPLVIKLQTNQLLFFSFLFCVCKSSRRYVITHKMFNAYNLCLKHHFKTC